MRNDWARKVSFQYVPETCYEMDTIFNDLADKLEQYVDNSNFDLVQKLLDAASEKMKRRITFPFRDGFIDYIVDNEAQS